MPIRFLATQDGGRALSLPPLELTPEQTSPEGLRKAFFKRTGQHAFVLHDGGVGLGLEDPYLVRLEGDAPGATDVYPVLEHARAWQQPGWFRERSLGSSLSSARRS